jgi:Glycosyltransferase 61
MIRRFGPTIPAVSIAVAPAKIFTYPTGLAGCWPTSIQEICLPGYRVTQPEIKLTIRKGSTETLGIKQRNPLRTLYTKVLPPIKIEEGCVFDARYEGDGNIAHLLDSVVPAAMAAQRSYPKITVVLRAKATAMAKSVFSLLQVPILCTDAEIYGELVVRSEPGLHKFSGAGLYSLVCGDISFEGYKENTPEKIFISRKGTRILLNEIEVESVLKEYGFQKFYFEDMPVAEQWSLARNAKAIVGIHGAALISFGFNRNAVKVVEMFHPGYVVNWFRHITNAVGGTWCGVTGRLPPDIIQRLDYKHDILRYQRHPTQINITSLRMALDAVGIR